ncbi:hypothetical protein JTB14_012894 [Gonioctena quinquepunctata]|nr:hypothetical protein JTB14_012894 [Gonioctena quinquepunctata]
METDSETYSVDGIIRKKRIICPETGNEKKARREKRNNEHEAEPCNCGGNKTTHAFLHRIKENGTTVRHMCIGTKEKTESQIGRGLYTRDEYQKHAIQLKKLVSDYERELITSKESQSSDQMDTDNSEPKTQAPTNRLAEEDESLIMKSKRLQKEKLHKKLAAKEKVKKAKEISQRYHWDVY